MCYQNHNGLRFHTEYSIGWQKMHVWIRDCVGDNHQGVRLETYPLENDFTTEEPTMRLGMEEVQAFMDSLWAAGIRPSHLRGHKDLEPIIRAKDEVIAAKEAHIIDLRSLTIDTL
jgi:hypothetical protein